MNAEAPELDGHHALGGAEAESFRRDGHVTLRGVLSAAEVAAYRQPICDAADTISPLEPSDSEGDVYRRAFDQHMNLWRVSETVERFVRSPRLGRLAAELLGVERVRVYHDQALFKVAGGGHTPWHQDMHYWPLDTNQAITMWMPLVDVTPEMGELRFASGSHQLGRLADIPISEGSDAHFEQFLVDHQLSEARTGHMVAGDASFHAAWTLHAAVANATEVRREVMTVIWFADGARVTEPTNDGQRNDLAQWLPGLKPGDLAASEINPVI